jgi:AcrR family transcriptional regulator
VPRTVDHVERRESVARAARAVIARDGLDGASVRRVADELGSSTTAVTHYFASREELMAAAIGDAYRAAAERMAARADATAGSPLATLAATLEETLPLDAERRDEARVWLAFWAGAAVGDRLREVQRAGYATWRDLVARLLREAARAGELRDGVDPRSEGERLLLLVDGLTLQATLEPERLPPRRQQALLRAELERLRRPRRAGEDPKV